MSILKYLEAALCCDNVSGSTHQTQNPPNKLLSSRKPSSLFAARTLLRIALEGRVGGRMKSSTDSFRGRASESLRRRELIKPAADFKSGLADSVNKSIYTSAIHRSSESAVGPSEWTSRKRWQGLPGRPDGGASCGRVITEEGRDHKHKGRNDKHINGE